MIGVAYSMKMIKSTSILKKELFQVDIKRFDCYYKYTSQAVTCWRNKVNKPIIVYPDADNDTAEIFSGELGIRLKKIGNFEYFNGEPTCDNEFKNRIRNADAIILGWRLPVDVMKMQKIKTNRFYRHWCIEFC